MSAGGCSDKYCPKLQQFAGSSRRSSAADLSRRPDRPVKSHWLSDGGVLRSAGIRVTERQRQLLSAAQSEWAGRVTRVSDLSPAYSMNRHALQCQGELVELRCGTRIAHRSRQSDPGVRGQVLRAHRTQRRAHSHDFQAQCSALLPAREPSDRQPCRPCSRPTARQAFAECTRSPNSSQSQPRVPHRSVS